MNISKKLTFVCLASLLFFRSQIAVGQEASGSQYTEPIFKETEKFINCKLYKRNDQSSQKSLEVIADSFPYLSSFDYWRGKTNNGVIVSFSGSSLAFFGVNELTSTICSDGADENGNAVGGCQDQAEGEIDINMPYFPNGKYANIFDPFGKKVLTIDLSSKATCNENDQCDGPIEDGENCPQDCKKNEPKIDPAVVQLAANNQAATQEAEKKISLADLGWWGIAILIVLLAGGGIGYFAYRRNKED